MSNAKTLRALIVDDEPIARKGVRSLLKSEEQIEVIGEAANGLEAIEMISKKSPDVVFLDVQMPGLDGFGVIEQIGVGKMPVIIFVTAYDLHALKAFQVHAIDYLLKPINPDNFHIAVERARSLLQTEKSVDINKKLVALLQTMNVNQEYHKRFVLKSTGRMVIVNVDEIDWIEADGDYVRLYVKGRYQLMRERISAIEQQINPAQFIRIHRSVIVRIDRIKEMKPLLNGDHLLTLHDGTQLSLSRTYRDKVLGLIAQA